MAPDPWTVAYLIPSIFIGTCFLLILVKKHRDGKVQPLDEDEAVESLANPVAITVALLLTLGHAVFLSDFQPILPFPLDLVTLVLYAGFIVVFGIICLREYRRYDGPPFETKDEPDLNLKYEIIRKTTHAVIVAIVACYVAIGPAFIALANVILVTLGASPLDAPLAYHGQYTVTFFTMIAFLGLATSEIVRVFFYRAYPLKGVKAIFRRKEVGAALGSHISLAVGCLSVILIFGYRAQEIVMASIAISAIGDGAASIVGKRFGAHKYKTAFSKKKKTLEGLITATLVSFVLSFIFLIYRYGIFSFSIAFVAVGVIALIDWLSPRVSDNLLNPIGTAFAMYAVAFLLGLG